MDKKKNIDFDTVPINSIDIQPKGENLEFNLTKINDLIRGIAKRNAEKLLNGGKINADVEYVIEGNTYESLTTISFDGKEVVAKGGYAQIADFDETWDPQV